MRFNTNKNRPAHEVLSMKWLKHINLISHVWAHYRFGLVKLPPLWQAFVRNSIQWQVFFTESLYTWNSIWQDMLNKMPFFLVWIGAGIYCAELVWILYAQVVDKSSMLSTYEEASRQIKYKNYTISPLLCTRFWLKTSNLGIIRIVSERDWKNRIQKDARW